jgi:peptidyl-prolyl cis-trans isomerase A (cyclophilin A)
MTGINHTKGAISMARFEPGTATGDFSLLVSDVEGLDAHPAASDPDEQAGYAAFGHIVSGMDVALAIFDAPIDPEAGEGFMKGQMIAQPVTIVRVRREAP